MGKLVPFLARISKVLKVLVFFVNSNEHVLKVATSFTSAYVTP